MKSFVLQVLASLVLGIYCSAHAVEVGTGAEWREHGGAQDGSGYSRLEKINVGNVSRLGLAWSMDLPGEQVLEATPLAVDGALYFTGSNSKVYAVDAVSGKQLWSYDPEVWKNNPAKMKYFPTVNRGVAYADGRVFVGVFDGRLVALDAKTGKVAWSVQNLEKERVNTSTGAPIVFKGKVLIGNAGSDFNERGYVTAFDAATGKRLWRFYTTPGEPSQNKGDPAMERAAATWSGEYWKTGTGGSVWNGMTYDPELDLVFIGTGNAGPYDPAVRSPGDGDNLYIASIVALNPDTGKYVWHYQENPREGWDYKSTPNIISTTLPIDGKPRKVLLHAPTNGFFYVLDAKTGKLLSAEKIGKVTWAERIDLTTGRPVEAKGIRYESGEAILFPSALGAHSWQPMTFNPRTGLVYIPYIQFGALYKKATTPDGLKFVMTTAVVQDPEDGKGALLAWDPIQQKARWKVQYPFMWNGGTLATAGGLVFQGTADGFFRAYDAANGKEVWKFGTGLGINAPPITYEINGTQYISVLVGYGGMNALGTEAMNAGWKYNAQPRRLVTFALGGKGKLAPTAPQDFTLKPIDDPALKVSEADVKAGDLLFNFHCRICHGIDAVSAGAPAPDLRESSIALSQDALWQVLHEGTLLPQGMPRFDEISETQARQLHASIRAAARKAIAEQRSKGNRNLNY